MKKIDVIILSSDEEDVIEDAIKSVKGWANEIIIIDAGSTDSTKKISEKNKARLIVNKFKDFSTQRNFGLKQAKSEWVLYLDADERATELFKKEVERKIENTDKAGFFIKRKTYYFGKDWRMEDRIARLFKKEKFDKWTGVVHETAHVNGELGEIHSPIQHFTHRNISQMVDKTNRWSEYEAMLRFDAHHPKMKPWRFIRVMISEFLRSYFKDGGYKNGTYGFIEAIYQSYSIFITYAKLWEMQKNS